jgi:hypothetical protein
VFDGRNLYEPDVLQSLGLKYYAIGRGQSVKQTGPAYGRRKTDKIQKAAG